GRTPLRAIGRTVLRSLAIEVLELEQDVFDLTLEGPGLERRRGRSDARAQRLTAAERRELVVAQVMVKGALAACALASDQIAQHRVLFTQRDDADRDRHVARLFARRADG